MQRKCERYKHDLNAMADRLSERLNAKVAQAIQQLLVDKHEQNNKAQLSFASTEGQDKKPGPSVSTNSRGQISTEMLQPVVDDCSTVTATAATTVVLDVETELKRHQDTHTQVKVTATSSSPSPSSAEMRAATMSMHTRFQRQDQLSNLNKALDVSVKSVSRSESSFDKVAEPLSMQQLTTTTSTTERKQQNRLDNAIMRPSTPVHRSNIQCTVVGHKSAQTLRFIRDHAKLNDSMIRVVLKHQPIRYAVNVHVPVRNDSVDCKLCVYQCTEAKHLKQIVSCDFIVICFSVVDKLSYQEIQHVWLKWFRELCPDTPYLLVGTQTDKRQHHDRNFQVGYKKGHKLSQEIGAVAYYKCSYIDVNSVESMFMYVAQHVVDNNYETR